MCERVDPAQVLYLPFLAFVPCIVCCSFLKAVEFYLSLNWFLCLLPGGENTGCTFKNACNDAETPKHDFLGFTLLTHSPLVL